MAAREAGVGREPCAVARLLAARAHETDAEAAVTQLSEAEELMREELDASRAVLGDKHMDTLASISNLAQLLFQRGKHVEAAPLAREGLELSVWLLGTTHTHTVIMHQLLGNIEYSHEHARASLLLLASWRAPGESWTLSV